MRKSVLILVAVLLFQNILGWVFKNQSPAFLMIVNIASFLGYLVIFIMAIRIDLTDERIVSFIKITIFMSVYNVFVSLITKFGVYETEITPLLPTFYSQFGDNIMMGTFYHSEIYGEYGMVIFFLILPFLAIHRSYGISKKVLTLGLIISALNCFLSFSRSSVALMIIGTIFFLFVYFSKKSSQSVFRQYAPFLLITVGVIAVLWGPLRLGFLIERFIYEDLAAPITIGGEQNIITGEGTPREVAFSYFIKRLPQEDWFIGYGWGVPQSNKTAWFGDPNIKRADYHSLYLSLPMLYGWMGAVAFVMLILFLIYGLYKRVNTFKIISSYKEVISVGLLLLLIAITINEYKISLLRINTYHMIFWIWIGFGYSLLTSRREV
ncbi:MAG: O-antigen ligase family protein [Ignavibacteriaceae bacterium]|nr:O-antigen ligase family protein [Ignavibacteriaceae bacterium]